VSDGRWPVGEAEVQNLIDHGEIEEVEPSAEHAELLMRQAETHLASVAALLPGDPPGAFAVLYDAARKSLGAVLAIQGLRATNKNGHRATQEAIEAQLGPNASKVVRPFRALRLRRHDAEYPALDTPEVTVEEAEEALSDARGIVAAMKKFLPNVGSWRD
jgi:HEPN domain-containing protein